MAFLCTAGTGLCCTEVGEEFAFISLAAHEKPWPQDVFVHVELRGEEGSGVILWPIEFIYLFFLFHFSDCALEDSCSPSNKNSAPIPVALLG